MNCRETMELTADYLNGTLEAAVQAEVKSHLADCAACRETMRASQEIWTQLGILPEAQPSPTLRVRVDAMIDAYRQGMTQPSATPERHMGLGEWFKAFWSWQPALQFALLILAFLVGSMTQMLFPARERTPQAITELRDEISNLREQMTLTLLRQPSANERIEGVNWSYGAGQGDDKVVSALLQALQSDPNVNVRVAAADALGQFIGNGAVKQGLLRTLAIEQSPLVQVELIDLLVKFREKESIPMLKTMSGNEQLDPAVRQQADWGLRQLI